MYVFLHPLLNAEKPDSFRHGDFRVSDGSYIRASEDGRGFTDEEIKQIQRILAEHISDMNLEQFSVHEILPAHYHELPSKSDRHKDINERLRFYVGYDPDISVAWDRLTLEEPALPSDERFRVSFIGTSL